MKSLIKTVLAVALMGFALGCDEEQSGSAVQAGAPKIIAELGEAGARTCIESPESVSGAVPMLWTPGDTLGVFTSGGAVNAVFTLEGNSAVKYGSFKSTSSVSGEITYAYYPYASANAGKSVAGLAGSVLKTQTIAADNIECDYKWGEANGTDKSGNYRFKFHNMFSLVRFKIDASGTSLAGETLEKIVMNVTRNGAAVPVTGGFTFNAANGSYTIASNRFNTLTTRWDVPLTGTLAGFATVFPEIKAGDKLTFVIVTAEHEAIVSVTSKVDFAPEMYYTFPLALANFSGLKVYSKAGTFKAATYNVKSSTSGSIGTAITNAGWDFFGLSEDFSNVSKNLGTYSFGTRSRGTLSFWGSAPKDGLGFATLNSTCSWSNEYVEEFTEEYGGLTDGANTAVDKGFRHYIVTLKDGTQVDVIITHMNTYSDSGTGHINCQHSQLKQVATYINKIWSANKRPIIFMGDTNLRYTRHDFQTYFWNVLNPSLIVNDPWVDTQWDGKYPDYPSKSLMVSDATGTNSETDIMCSNTQNGEVVDKVIYINNPEASVQIKALSYLRDMSFDGLSDHMPITVEFSYMK